MNVCISVSFSLTQLLTVYRILLGTKIHEKKVFQCLLRCNLVTSIIVESFFYPLATDSSVRRLSNLPSTNSTKRVVLWCLPFLWQEILIVLVIPVRFVSY